MSLFIYDGIGGAKQKNLDYRRRAKRHHPREGWIDETGRRSDPTKNTVNIETGAEDAGYRSGSDAKKGERLLLGT